MQRIPNVVQKLNDLLQQPHQKTVIDIDLMLDYTRVLYADLLEWRKTVSPAAAVQEPTLSEVVRAMAKEEINSVNVTAQPPVATNKTPELIINNTQELPKEIPVKSEEILAKLSHLTDPMPKNEGPGVIDSPFPQPFTFASLANAVSKPKIEKDIRHYLGINDRYLFLNELFKKDMNAFEHSLDEINKMESFDEAKDWLLQTAAWNYGWEEDNVALQTFYALLNQFFATRE